ncbi:MAG: hydrogenase maturation protease [Acidimicrobiales bacterium]
MTGPRILVAGIGNIFLSDDGFGVEAVNQLAGSLLPTGVRALDIGIRGLHLAYELLNGYDLLVLLDAVPLGEPPGTLAVIEPEPPSSSALRSGEAAFTLDAHSMSPLVVLDLLETLGGSVPHVRVVGCQPKSVEEGIGLSSAVAAAISPAVDVVGEVLASFEGAFT